MLCTNCNRFCKKDGKSKHAPAISCAGGKAEACLIKHLFYFSVIL